MTALARHLADRIAAQGPLSVAEYMGECLLHPRHGYYTTRDPLGARGDFTTAPEISQMFGELLGLCLAQAWADQGAPGRFALAELGPGRGTLMADALRAVRGVPGFLDAAELHLVEASPTLRAAQDSALEGHAPRWHDSVETLPDDMPLYLVANEFLDALPIRQFRRMPGGWAEIVVTVTEGALAFALAPPGPAPLPTLAAREADTREGEIVEIRPATEPIAAAIAARIAAHGGAAIFVDYGTWRGVGDTLQALRGHAPEPPLASPGAADLTSHVDFAPLAEAARAAGAAASGLTPQGVLLERLGITARARALAARLGGAKLDAHVAAHRRLTHPEEMGNLFKALALHPVQAPCPPGFDP